MFAAEVITGLSARVNPTCSRMPVTANTNASLQRGSERNRPFQLDCIAHRDKGRYVSQNSKPVRPKAFDQAFKLPRRLSKPRTPKIAASMNAASETHTQA